MKELQKSAKWGTDRRKMKKLVLAILLVGSLLPAAGCSDRKPVETTPTETKPTATTAPAATTEATAPADPAADALEALRSGIGNSPCGIAAASLGYVYLEAPGDLVEILNERTPQFCEEYPFVLELLKESIVGGLYGDLFVVIPKDPNATVTVNRAKEDGNGGYSYTDTIYTSQSGEPFMLVCGYGEYLPDTQVTVTSGTEKYVWVPEMTERSYIKALYNDREEAILYDFSPYGEAASYSYFDMLTWGWRLPDEEDLAGKAWGWAQEMSDGRYASCLISFGTDTAEVRWNDGDDTQGKSYSGAPWELSHSGDYAVLTLDFDRMAGKLSYNLMYDEEYGSLYIMRDVTDGIIEPGMEWLYRYMEPVSMNAPEPMEMVGTWERFRTEFEGYQEDTSGTCTLVITGESEQTLMISYADKEYPDSNYQNKTLTVRQGQVYNGCGNSLWLADVDHVGQYDTTYCVTLLEDGTLLLQNYWEVDGSMNASYAWFRRAD